MIDLFQIVYVISWIEKNTVLSNKFVNSIDISSGYIFAGTFGGGFFKANLNDLVPSEVKDNPYSNKIDFNFFPNPATNKITIYQNNGLQPLVLNGNISIFNSLGLEVKRIEEKDLQGKSSVNISTEEFPAGMYYCVINTGSNKYTKSFVVVK